MLTSIFDGIKSKTPFALAKRGLDIYRWFYFERFGLSEDSAFFQFFCTFSDLKAIVVDLYFIVAFLEAAVLFPGKLNCLGFSSFYINRNFCSENLVAIFTGCETSRTQCWNR